MNLVDESGKSSGGSKKVFLLGGTALVILVGIIIVLLICAGIINKSKVTLMVNSKKYDTSKYLLEENDTLYIGVEDLANMLSPEYEYKPGNKTSEAENQCYVTNGNESTFFEVGSDLIYKELEASHERSYYTIEKPIIRSEDNKKIYMPLNAAKLAFNTAFTNTNNHYTLVSMGTLEAIYTNSGKKEDKSFILDSSIVWDTDYQNKVLLKEGLVVKKGPDEKLGIAVVSKTTDKKTKKTTVSTQNVIAPKYTSILYVEKYNYLIVESDDKKGVVQLNKDDSGKFTVSTVVNPQYDDITPITDKLFLVTKITKDERNEKKETRKYGIIKCTDREEDDIVMATEYDQIGFALSDFPDNGLTNSYIIYDTLIPVKKDGLWGFANLKGTIVTKLQYDGIGYADNNNANSNVLIIPEVEAIVVKKGQYYGMVSKTNRMLVKTALTRVYKDTVNGKTTYTMVYKDQLLNVEEYFEKVVNKGNEESTTQTDSSNEDETDNKEQSDSSNEEKKNNSTTAEENPDEYEDVAEEN